MAENKKSVLLYCDLIYTVEKLTNEQAGKLFKHYLRYVNDMNPETDDPMVDLVFEHIKHQLKRDLKKWENIKVKRSEAGKKSAEIRKQQKATKSTSVKSVEQKATKSTVIDTVTVNDILLEKETKELFNYWLDYRKEIKKPIKSEKTLISLAKKIKSNGYEISKQVVENSINNGWQGLFWDRIPTQKPKEEIVAGRQTKETIIKNKQGW